MDVKNATVCVLSINLVIDVADGVETRRASLQSAIGPDLAVDVKVMQQALTIAHAVEKLWAGEPSKEAA